MSSAHIALMTFPRPNGIRYLDGTLVSLLSSDPLVRAEMVTISVGTSERSFLDGLDSRGVSIEALEPALWESIASARPLRRIGYNMRQAYTACLASGSDWVVVAEDDVRFAGNWLQLAIAEAERAKPFTGGPILMTLCTSYDSVAFQRLHTSVPTLQHNDPLHFWGQQCMLVDAATAKRLLVHIDTGIRSWDGNNDSLPHNFRRAGDQLIKWFAHENKIPILAPEWSLVKHIGEHCSWGQGGISHAFKCPTLRFKDG